MMAGKVPPGIAMAAAEDAEEAHEGVGWQAPSIADHAGDSAQMPRWDPAADLVGEQYASAGLASIKSEVLSSVFSAVPCGVKWPWSGSERNYIYADFCVYVVLLMVFLFTTLWPTSNQAFDAYHLVQSVQTTLLEENRPEPEISYFTVNELAGLSRWIRGPFFAVVYGFDPQSDPEGPLQALQYRVPGLYLASTTILGPIRLRQLRVTSDSCKVDEKWEGPVKSCFSPYRYSSTAVQTPGTTDTDYYKNWRRYANQIETRILESNPEDTSQPPFSDSAINKVKNAFVYNDHTNSGWYRGRLAWGYREGGFVADLPHDNHTEAAEILQLLDRAGWMDQQTRALFVEFSLYLASAELLLSARLIAEVHASGTTWMDISLEPINLEVYQLSNKMQFALHIVSLCIGMLAIAWDVYGMFTRSRHYRRTGSGWLWLIIALTMYSGMVAAAALHLHNIVQTDALRAQYASKGDAVYLPTHALGYHISVERGLWSITSFIVWFRLLNFTAQLPVLGVLGRTIARALPQVAAFFLISCVIFLAFAQCFFMAYYASVPGYQSYQGAIMSVLRFTVLDFDYDALSQENRLLTPLLFFLLLLVVFFIWVNVMVAIISEVYQQEQSNQAITFDEDFEGMSRMIKLPENDHDAMVAHTPIKPAPETSIPEEVELTPEKFNRVRFIPLEAFSEGEVVTVDMYMHFDRLATTEDTRSLKRITSVTERASISELEQHRGIYARLGCRSKLILDPGYKGTQPMELQALYFSKEFHNITTARLWWDERKSLFDVREQLVRYLLNKVWQYSSMAAGVFRRCQGPRKGHRGLTSQVSHDQASIPVAY